MAMHSCIKNNNDTGSRRCGKSSVNTKKNKPKLTSPSCRRGRYGLYFGIWPSRELFVSVSLQWIFGVDWCDGWHSVDVLASTASILNLCVISLDR